MSLASPLVRPDRLFEYFAVIGPGDKCSFIEESNLLAPVLEDRFPRVARDGAPFPELVTLFCFPHGIGCRALDLRRTESPRSQALEHMFVLTAVDGAMLYGAAAVFETALSEQNTAIVAGHLAAPADSRYVAERAVVLLSRWPFLHVLGRTAHALASACAVGGNSTTPLERWISNLICDVPLPPTGLVTVQFNVAGKVIAASRPPPNKLPLADVPFANFLNRMGASLVDVVIEALLERKIIFVSETPHALLPAVEAVRALLFPFDWQHVYVPLLPPHMSDVLDAPVPFMLGMVSDARAFAESAAPDVCVVDLDRGVLRKRMQTPTPPERARDKLVHAVAACLATARAGSTGGADVSGSLRSAFLRFMVSILLRYREYITLPPAPAIASFDREGFVAAHSASSQPFFEQLTQTQLFSVFVDDRLLPGEGRNEMFLRALFDEHIAAKRNRSALRISKARTPFLDDTTAAHAAVHAAPPAQPLAEAVAFSTLPRLREDLLLELCPPPSLLSRAEPVLSSLATRARTAAAEREAVLSQAARDLEARERAVRAAESERRRALLQARKDKAATRIQTIFRGFRHRRDYRKLLHATVLLQDRQRYRRLYRGVRVLQAMVRLRRARRAATAIQRRYRTRRQRALFLSMRSAARLFQARFRFRRMVRAARLLQTRLRFVRLRRAVCVVQGRMRAILARRRFLRVRKAVLCFQASWRGHVARMQFRPVLVAAHNAALSAAAACWVAAGTPIHTRLAFVRRIREPSLFNLMLLRVEQTKMASAPAPSWSMRRALRTERHLLAERLGVVLDDAMRTTLYAAWSVPADGKQRKRKLVKAMLACPERMLEAAEVLSKVTI